MAAIVNTDQVDLVSLAVDISKKLPVYARPYFLRLTEELDITGTYKLKKRDLQLQGYNPDDVDDAMFFLDHKSNQYIPLDKHLYTEISSNRIRFWKKVDAFRNIIVIISTLNINSFYLKILSGTILI